MYSGALGVLQKELLGKVDMDEVVEDMVVEMGCSTEVQTVGQCSDVSLTEWSCLLLILCTLV